jgi:hypothetical protein
MNDVSITADVSHTAMWVVIPQTLNPTRVCRISCGDNAWQHQTFRFQVALSLSRDASQLAQSGIVISVLKMQTSMVRFSRTVFARILSQYQRLI